MVDTLHKLEVLWLITLVGAGQAGLTVAARLKMLRVTRLIIEQHDRVGDSWRKRYHYLVLHDPVWYDHLPYIPFPPTWPVFTPKDKLAEFFEAYVTLLELNVLMKSTIKSSEWDKEKGVWTVSISRQLSDGSTNTHIFHPSHIIQATGHLGLKNEPKFKGVETFQGDRICHSSEFSGARQGTIGKKAVVVGCCNSGHDIAQDFVENGYEVTMVQRSSTVVVSSAALTDISMASLYTESGPPVEDADMMHSLPSTIFKAVQAQIYKLQKRHDQVILTGLEESVFKINDGPDGAGLFFQYFQRGGGYYIDVGASKLIIDGKIKIKQGQEVAEILPSGIRFPDGSTLEADEIILATGYQDMKSHTRLVFGDKVADSIGGVWGFNEEGEIRTMWQQSGHPGFWIHGGNLAFCRYYSCLLALQIKAIEIGLYEYGEI